MKSKGLTAQPSNNQCFHHIETSQLICRANQLTGFYIMGAMIVKGLKNLQIKIFRVFEYGLF